jgi:6-phosphogluconolactonase (cycloisomerase 2 family)
MPDNELKSDNLANFRARSSGTLARLAIALSVLALSCGESRAGNTKDFVFVMTNEAAPGLNAIRTFIRDANGLLTESSDSPTLTGGTGVHPTADLTFANVGPFDSDQCMILNSDRTMLFAVNGGSDTIAVFNVNPNGKLKAAKGSPFPSHGVNPCTVGLAGDSLLVVYNKDYDLGRPGFNPATRQGNYVTFTIDNQGALTYVPGSSVPAGTDGSIGPGAPTPTQALISKDGKLAFDANFFGFHLRSFQIEANGLLLPADSVTIPPPGGTNPKGLAIPLGLQVHPTQPILFVGFVLDQAVGIYAFGPQGQLVFMNAVTGVGMGPCWLLTNSAGTRLYTANNFDNSVSVFDITSPFFPVKLQQVTLAQGPNNAAPFQLTFDEDEEFLHVVTQAAAPGQSPLLANGLNVLKVAADGTLTVVDFVPLPSFDGSRPQGVAAK